MLTVNMNIKQSPQSEETAAENRIDQNILDNATIQTTCLKRDAGEPRRH